MRRAIRLGTGLFELAAAVLLASIAWQLPSRAEVEEARERAQQVTGEADRQVTLLREQLRAVGDPQYGGLPAASQSLGSLARGMEAWAAALDPAMIGKLRKGTAELAGFIDQQVAPAAARTAERLERAIADLVKDAESLNALVKEAPPDLKGAREIHDSLSRFGDGLDKVGFLISPDRLKTMREGFRGMEDALDTGAEQVDRLAGYSYPVVKFKGLRPEVDEKPFWPEGEKIASGMKKGAKAIREANREFEKQAANLPAVQRSLDESKKAILAMRDLLGRAVKNEARLDAVLKRLPESTARLTAQMPLLARDLQRVLKETGKLGEVAEGLRKAESLLVSAEKAWPDVREGLLMSATKLRDLQMRIEQNLENPSARLRQQQDSLERLGTRLEEVNHSLPELSNRAVGILTAVTWLMWILAVVAAMHGLATLLTRQTGDRVTG
jgi:hypothetical protein